MYHGTSLRALPEILREGLKPGEAGYVYLASEPETAGYFIWAFHRGKGAILEVDASGLPLEPDDFEEELGDRPIDRKLFRGKIFQTATRIPPSRIRILRIFDEGSPIPSEWIKLYEEWLGPSLSFLHRNPLRHQGQVQRGIRLRTYLSKLGDNRR